MEPTGGAELRSTLSASESGATALDSLQFTDEICRLISVPQDNASSFTALLELPAPQAVELLHSPESTEPFPSVAVKPPDIEDFKRSFHLPANSWLIEGAAKFSALDGEHSSPVTSSNVSGPSPAKEVKSEPVETVSSQPLVSDPTIDKKPNKKRKEWEKKAKDSSKKSKGAADDCTGETEKLPYVHVRARRGQATDSHSLAERARREKINARMKLLQELVPGCNKISGTALILDEIINHVQCLQRQVEFLSMRLAAANPRIDFNLDSICAAEGGAAMCSNFPSMFMPLMWPEVQVNGNHQQYQPEWQFEALEEPVWGRGEICHNYVTPENSLMSYDSSTNSATLQSNRMKMES